MFWKQHLTTLCGYQSYGSCWNSLASEWGWRGGAEVDGKQICSSHLSFRCVHPSGPPGPSSLALPTGCVCLMLCRASSKTSYAAESLPICYFTPRLPEDLPNTYTDMYVPVKTVLGGNAAVIQTSLWFNRACHMCGCVQITKKKRTVSALRGKATVLYSSNHLKWTPKSHYDCVVQESMAARSRIRKSNGGCFSVRLNSSEGPCAD